MVMDVFKAQGKRSKLVYETMVKPDMMKRGERIIHLGSSLGLAQGVEGMSDGRIKMPKGYTTQL